MIMRILQVGNPNSGYHLAKELRKRGIESDVIITKRDLAGRWGAINNPLTHDVKISEYPPWVKIFDDSKGRKSIRMLKEMRKYDVIHAYGFSPINAMFSGKPYIANSVGDDLRKTAFKKNLAGLLLRMAYRRANKFIYVWTVHKPLVEKLGIKEPLYFPRMWNFEIFQRKKKKIMENENLVLFFPTAELWETKGNDKFLKVFIKLCKEKQKIFLYYVEWEKDTRKARKLLSIPEVNGKIEFISGPISREKMKEYMEKSDIFVDQFNSGSFTRGALEAFSFEIPVLINLDESLHIQLHNESPPVINAKNEEEIYLKLKELSKDKSSLIKIAINAKEWLKKNYNLEKSVDEYIRIYQEIVKSH